MNFDDFSTLVRARRTHMFVDPERPVPTEIVQQLCELVQWAPNHKRTWPARFCVVTGEGRARLGNVAADAMAAAGDEPDRVAKTRTKYLRTPMSLVIGTAPGDTPNRTEENRDSVACGVQNLLLGAHALGIATYWGSCPKGANDAVAELVGFEPGTHITALLYLGWADGRHVAAPERPAVDLHRLS